MYESIYECTNRRNQTQNAEGSESETAHSATARRHHSIGFGTIVSEGRGQKKWHQGNKKRLKPPAAGRRLVVIHGLTNVEIEAKGGVMPPGN
jgi:hypothetical protein